MEAFQAALHGGRRPALEEFLTAESSDAILIELVHVELEFRLEQGESARVEEYLTRFPRLAQSPAAVAELAVAEFTVRRRHEPALDWDPYLQRFPVCREMSMGRFPDLPALPPLNQADSVPSADSDENDATLLEARPPDVEAYTGYPEIPGYTILAELGRGGMGVVYRAWQMTLNRTVALKMLHAARRTDAEQRARFRIEVETIALLQHPNIVQVYDLGEHEGRPFYAMEFIEGGNLAEHCRGEPQPARTAAEIVETLARAMEAVHARGIVHRDLKPSNVLWAAGASGLKITDFGLARRGPSDLTATGDVLGTPSYMAPEQAAGKVHEIGPTTDVYALGAILYELLTGRPPFRGVTLLDTLRQVQDLEPVPPRRMEPRTPRDLETICLKCLHKEPNKRYTGASALAEDLRLFLHGESVHARPPAWPECAVRWSRRRPALAVLLAAIGLLALAVPLALVGHLMQVQAALTREQDERERAGRAEQLAQRKEAEASVAHLAADLHLAHNLFKAGDVFQLPGLLEPHRRDIDEAEDGRGFAWWYLQRHSQAARPGLTAHDAPVRLLAYSPDGRLLVTCGGTPASLALKVWDRENGRLRFARPLHANGLHHRLAAAAYAPTAGLLAGITAPSIVTLWDAASGKERLGLPQDEHAYNLALSPDGRWLAVNGHSTTTLWDCTTGEKKAATPIAGIYTYLSVSPDGALLAADPQTPTLRGIQFWDVKAGRFLKPSDPGGTLQSLAYSPRGTFLLLIRRDGQGAIWDAGQRIPLHWSHTIGTGTSLAVSPDERTLAIGGSDGQIVLRDISTGRTRGHYRWQASPIVCLAFSPDNRTLAAATAEGTVREMDAAIEHFPDSLATTRVRGPLCWSPDGELIAVATANGSVHLFDRRTGRVRLELRCPVQNVRCLVFAPDGRTLATSCIGERLVRLWDTSDGRLRATTVGEVAEAFTLAFSPDGRHLASVEGRRILFWDAMTGAARGTLEAEKPIKDLCFTPDGRSLVTTGDALEVWDISGGESLPRKPAASERLSPGASRLAVTHDGRRLATGQKDGTVHIWRLSPERKLTTEGPELPWTTPRDAITSLGFAPDGQTLLVVHGAAARLCDLRTGGRHERVITAVACQGGLSPDGRTLAITESGQALRLWDVNAWKVSQPTEQPVERITSLAFSADGCRIITAGPIPFVRVKNRGLIISDTAPLRSSAESIRFWDVATGREQATTLSHRETMALPHVVARSPDGQVLAAGADDGSISLWNGSSGQWLRRLFISDSARLYTETCELARRVWTSSSPEYEHHGEAVRALAFSPDGRSLAAFGNRGSMRVWDTEEWKERGHGSSAGDGSPWIAFTPDSSGIVGSRGGQVCIWDGRTAAVRATVGKESDPLVLCGAFVPGKTVLAFGSWDGAIRLWKMDDGEVKRLPGGHQDRVLSLAFTPDGKTLASASWDRTVRLWNLAARREVASLEAHRGHVNAVAFSPDGRTLASGGDGEVYFWRR